MLVSPRTPTSTSPSPIPPSSATPGPVRAEVGPSPTRPVPGSGPALEHSPTGEPVLADFSYVIRGPHQMPHYGLIEARAWPKPATPVAGSFDDAVRAAKLLAKQAYDGIHGLPINQAHGILQAADGSLSVVPLGGFHREKDGPLFVDGRFFEATALSLQVVRRTKELAAIVGLDRVFDLRPTGAAAWVTDQPR